MPYLVVTVSPETAWSPPPWKPKKKPGFSRRRRRSRFWFRTPRATVTLANSAPTPSRTPFSRAPAPSRIRACKHPRRGSVADGRTSLVPGRSFPRRRRRRPSASRKTSARAAFPMILDSSWSAGSAILVISVRRHLGMKGSYLVNGRPSTQRLNDKPTISFHDLCTACCAQRAYARS
jgi:hypothetical protein